jgi:glycosyltransferase involved in cell wall biosynthesis
MTYWNDSGQPGKRQRRELVHSPPLLSVIVANYNNDPYIRECLDSILNQTYKHLEIIVFDDCSTDGSPQIIREYEKKYPGVVKGIFSTVNQGVARTRHEAILQASGDYITTLDSDDYYYNSQKLEKEMELIFHYKKTKGKDIIAFSNIVLVNKDKSTIRVESNDKNIKEGNIFIVMISRTCMIPRDFVTIKSAYFRVGGYDFSLRTHEDWDLKIRLSKRFEFYYTGCSGTAYRRHRDGLSSLPYVQRTNNFWRVFYSNYPLVPEENRKWVKERFLSFMKTRDRQFLKAAKTRGCLYGLKLHINRAIWEIRLKFPGPVDINRYRPTNEMLQ